MTGLRVPFAAALALATALVSPPALAQRATPMTPIAAPAEPTAIPLKTGGVTGGAAKEQWFEQDGFRFVRNVTAATLTPVLPDPAKATGAAAIVCPGGGFIFLSMDNEGYAVAKALADRGIAAFILKYRTKPTTVDPAKFQDEYNAMFANAGDPKVRLKPDEYLKTKPIQIEDSRAAFNLIRAHATEWHVDPKRVGIMGFSAGAMTTMLTALGAPDLEPAFIAPIYGSMEAVTVPANAPPMYAAIASDDPLFAKKGFGLLDSWQAAGKPVEFHMYQNGLHGYGLGREGTTTVGWIDSFVAWLDHNHILKPK